MYLGQVVEQADTSGSSALRAPVHAGAADVRADTGTGLGVPDIGLGWRFPIR